ncbi:hypothetical protein UCDDS831_g09354 [Diplodia seriata]|uniref:Uncharacterized protein n=1 Tax=Diplodia seriata TaxID=420778 RepID=A0A0G2DPU9_9PEZI|nr:hypothetical protein UCDDS831_g09354 [Diplodia seriata]
MTYYATMYSFEEDSFTDDNPVFDGYHGYLNNDAKASSSRRMIDNSSDVGMRKLDKKDSGRRTDANSQFEHADHGARTASPCMLDRSHID